MIGLLVGFAVLIKSIGIILIVAVIIDMAFKVLMLLREKKQTHIINTIISKTVIIIGTSAFVYFLINYNTYSVNEGTDHIFPEFI